MTSFFPQNSLGTGSTGSHIKALLGPTNTGKTHRAIERMVEHNGGVIGLPLRLLAREVYDRICAMVSPDAVALVTGEERIEPPRARFWVCTVESMPSYKNVPFVAVDEIQLATHPERGHVFTDRLLNARGTRETWFMGSDTMAPLLERLTPTARFETFERLSKLRYEDPRKLSALPKRSAVIAFSVSHVYELAEEIRACKGGVAVVLGALSPKARNAQVALFESGEVNHLVATDAIGMGLNLDIRHVFFASTQKFDGQQLRPLEPWEMGQIAGRAGRHTRDGGFGLTRGCADRQRLPNWLIESVERQRFEAARKIYYRNSDIDLDSIEALKASLAKAPFSKALIHARGMRDERALDLMLRFEDVARSVKRSPERVRVLWDVCRVPDFRQNSETSHVRLLAQLYRQLIGRGGRLDTDWIEGRIKNIENDEGDIDTMMRRIAHTRSFAYITHRSDWFADADPWRDRVLALEERLSDALHHRLTQHFVDERANIKVERVLPEDVRLDGDCVVSKTLNLGHISSFSFKANPEANRLFGQKTTRSFARRVSIQTAEAAARFFLEQGEIHWGQDLTPTWLDQSLAKLGRGARLDKPKVRMLPMDLLPEELRRKIQHKVEAWFKLEIQTLLEPLSDPEASGPMAGLLYILRIHLGVVPRHQARQQLESLTPQDRRTLSRIGVKMGVHHIYARSVFKSAFQAPRAACLVAWQGLEKIPSLPRQAAAPQTDWPRPFAAAFGYPEIGPRCIRVDLVEKITALLRKRAKTGPSALPSAPAKWLGCPVSVWEEIAAELGDGRSRKGRRSD